MHYLQARLWVFDLAILDEVPAELRLLRLVYLNSLLMQFLLMKTKEVFGEQSHSGLDQIPDRLLL